MTTSFKQFSLITLSAILLFAASASKAEANSFIDASSTLPEPFLATTTVQSIIIWPQIKAASAIVFDPVQGKVLYEKDADSVRPMASLVKLMTAAVADTIMNWPNHLEDKPVRIITMKDEDKADFSLKNGSLWMPRDLLAYMLVGSSNKAAETIASALVDRSVFLSLMNFSAQTWGLKHTAFYNPSGLSLTHPAQKNGIKAADTPGSLSTAREIAVMMARIIENHDDLLDSTRSSTASFSTGTGNSVTVKNTNESLPNLPIVFGKTGFTELAGGNLAVMIQKSPLSNPLIIVVLGSTVTERFTDVEALARVAQRESVAYQR